MLRKILGSVSALAVAAAASALLATPAMAQTQPAADSRLDVVVVTAQQRAEDLQDVPISAAALAEDKLESIFSAGEDVLALATRVPGLYAESSNGRVAPRFYIRGLGNSDFDLAASQPVSIVMDDVVMENVVLKSTPVFDLEQVEVYRGPQGTLFGRNTTAGIVRFTSARPTDTFEAKAAASYGSMGSFTFDGAISGPIGEGITARGSLLFQRRDDWIDNTLVPGDDNIGGYEEKAARVQFLFEPNDNLDVLVNVHGRDLDGTSAIFRANIVTQGTSGLNSNYDRDRVSYNQGGGNPQAYTGWGASANIVYDFGGVTLTSITAYENADGYSRGDIDGGAAGVGPGFIPFDSDTRDSLEDLDQFTQEIRLAGDTSQRLKWQAGAFFFDTEYTINTIGPFGFPPSTTLTQSNQSWAVYGQASYDLTDAWTLTGGLRWTDDEKDITVQGQPALARSVSDDHLSWEASAMYDVTPDFSVYGRVADGFRGPSIQGRDVAFFNPSAPSIAQSETILSWEAGWKSTLADGTVRLNGAVYTYEVEDMQITAVGGAGNLVQLLNADKGKAWGFEVDGEWAPLDNLVFTGGFSWADTEFDDPNLRVAPCGSGQCTVLDPVSGGFANIDGNPFPNAPEFIADFTARYSIPLGSDAELFAFTDWAFQGETNILLYETREFIVDDQFEGGLKFGWARTDGSLELAVFARNITDEDNLKGAIDFNNNTGFVNEPRVIGVSLRIRN